MASYGTHSYEIRRNSGAGIAIGNPDATSHLLEANFGLNYGEGDFMHGPYAELRYIAGRINAYNEIGPGGVFVDENDVDRQN